VRDDGHGVQGADQSGLGTTLITTWVRATAGEWALDSSDSGVTVTAELRPAATPQSKV
jgi:two-component sensor histidine kinase